MSVIVKRTIELAGGGSIGVEAYPEGEDTPVVIDTSNAEDRAYLSDAEADELAGAAQLARTNE